MKWTICVSSWIALAALLVSCASPPEAHKNALDLMSRDCFLRENNYVAAIVRQAFDKGEVDYDALDYHLRMAFLFSTSEESGYGPSQLLMKNNEIAREIYKLIKKESEALNARQQRKLAKLVEEDLEEHGLCSWMLDLARREDSLSYLTSLKAADAEKYKMSHYVYLKLRLVEMAEKGKVAAEGDR